MNIIFPEGSLHFTDLVTFSGTLAAAGWGIWNYQKAQAWKRQEFLASEIKAFQADPIIHNVCRMLDWDGRYLSLKPLASSYEEPIIIYSWRLRKDFDAMLEQLPQKVLDNHLILEEALVSHHLHNGFSDSQTIVRDYFDYFFDRLTMFNNYAESNIVSYQDIFVYLGYWLKQIQDSKLNFLLYLDTYGYNKVLKLLYKRNPKLIGPDMDLEPPLCRNMYISSR